MKRIYAALALFVVTITACHSQQPPSPPVYSCPTAVSGGSNFTVLNPPAANDQSAASITGTSTTDTPGVGTWAYSLQAWAEPNGAPPYQVSAPSNTASATTTVADPVVHLTWTAPATTGVYSSYTYILSRAACTVVGVPLAPPLNPPTVAVSAVERPTKQLPGAPVLKRLVASK